MYACAIASLVVRYRRGGDTERRQLLWLLLAGLAALAYGAVVWGIFDTGPILGLLVFTLIPAAVAVAVLRYQLLDIRLVVSRTLVYVLLTAGAAGAYVGMVALLDVMVRSRVSLESAVVASVIIAIGFNPARVRLQRLIDRGLYGDRRDPVRAVSLVGERLAGTGAAGLAGVLEALCDSLRLPFAAVRFGPAEAAAYGTAPELLHRTGLSYDGARIGELIVGLQVRAAPAQPARHRRAGTAGRAAGGRAARHRAVGRAAGVAAVHRRRARGGAPQAPARPARRARPRADRDRVQGRRGPQHPARPSQRRPANCSARLRADTTAAIADIRRLVYDLRPPALDDLGLIGSVRAAVRPAGPAAGRRQRPRAISAPESLPPLPAAVEVAAYRIITEAMTNAARHSGATRIEVRLALAGGDGLLHRGPRRRAGPSGAAAPARWPGSPVFGLDLDARARGGTRRLVPGRPGPGGGGRVTASLPLTAGQRPAGGPGGRPGPADAAQRPARAGRS